MAVPPTVARPLSRQACLALERRTGRDAGVTLESIPVRLDFGTSTTA
jgi:hypothetical protein